MSKIFKLAPKVRYVQPRNGKLLAFLGATYMSLHLHGLAIPVLKQALELGEMEQDIYFYLAFSYFGLNNMNEAVNICKEGLTVNLSWDRLRHSLGTFYLLLKDKEEAIKIAKHLEGQKSPFSSDLMKMIKEDDPEKDKIEELKSKQEAKEYLDKALKLTMKREFKDGVKDLISALQSDDQLAPAYTILGMILDDYGLIDEGLSLHKRAIELDPSLADAYNNLGYALQVKGKLPEAIDAYKKALELDPKSVQTHNNIGALYDFLGDYERGLSHFREALKLDPNRIITFRNLGWVYMALGRVDEALSTYKKYAELYPKETIPKQAIARIYREIALYGEGEKEYLLALQIDPENMGCWLDLGECYIEMGRKEKLDEVVQRVLLLSPRSPADNFRMAKIMQKLDKEISIEYWRRYLSIAEQYPLDPNDVAYAKIQLISLIGREN